MDRDILKNKWGWTNLLKKDKNKDFSKEKIKSVLESNDFLKLEENICSKLYMTSKDKLIMQNIFILLRKLGLYSIENLEILYKNINYGEKWIGIGDIKFDREKLIPNADFNKKPNKYGVYTSNEKGVFKIQDISGVDYKLTQSAYKKECTKQDKEPLLYSHIKIALQHLPGKFTENKSFLGANIFGKLLDIPLNGLIDESGKWLYNNDRGYINTASLYSNNSIGGFGFDNRGGRLRQNHSINKARSCIVLYKE